MPNLTIDDQRTTARRARAWVRRGDSVTVAAEKCNISRAHYYRLVEALIEYETADPPAALAECNAAWERDLDEIREFLKRGATAQELIPKYAVVVPWDIFNIEKQVKAELEAAGDIDPLLA